MVGLIDPFAPVPMPTAVDVDRVRRESLGRVDTMMQGGLAGIAPQTATQQTQPTAPSGQLLFNPVTNEMSAGGRTFAADDIKSVLSVPDYLQSPTGPEPVGPEWKVMSPGEYAARAKAFSERRGTGELIGRGFKNLAYGLGTLPGTAASLAGFEETGAALRAPVESLLGDSENEQLRSALIAESSSIWEQAIDAGIESIPMLIGSLVGGVGAASWASRAGMAASSVAKAGTIGAATFNFPTHLAGMYDAAVSNNADMTSLETKVGIIGGATLNSYLDTLGIESRLLSPIARNALETGAKNAIRRRLTSGIATGAVEGITETAQTAIESLMFDPTVRDNMSPKDWKTLFPYIADRYGEAGAVSFLAGLGLGGLTGTIMPHGALAGKPKTPVDPNKPVDLNAKAAEQAASTTAPMTGLGPVVPNLSPEEAALAANWEANNALGPAIPSLGVSEQALADQWQSTLGPMPLTPEMRQAAAAADTAKGRTLLAPGATQPAAAPAPMETLILRPSQRADGRAPMLLAPSEMVQPTTPAPMERLLLRPSQRADARRPMLLAPSEMVQPAAPAAPEAVPTAPTAPTAPAAPAPAVPAGPATWASKDYDYPVEVMAEPAQAGPDGRFYQKVRTPDGQETFVPADELRPGAPVAEATAQNPLKAKAQAAKQAKNASKKAQADAAMAAAAPAAAPAAAAAAPAAAPVKGKPLTKKQREAAAKATAPAPAPTAPALDATYPLASKFKEIRRFLSGYTTSGSTDLRNGLGDTIGDYADWLGARTDAEWALIGDEFSVSDNPFMNASGLQDPAQVQARLDKFTALIAPPPAPTTPTGKAKVQKQAAAKPTAPKQAAVQRGKPQPRAEAVPEITGARTGGAEATAAANAVKTLDLVEGGTRAKTVRRSAEEIAAQQTAERAAPTAAQTRAVVTKEDAIKRAETEAARVAKVKQDLSATMVAEVDELIADVQQAVADGDTFARDSALFELRRMSSQRATGLRDTDPELAAAMRAQMRAAKKYIESLPEEDRALADELFERFKKVGTVEEIVAEAAALNEAVGGESAITRLNAMLDTYAQDRDNLPPGFMTEFRKTAIEVKGLGEEGRTAMRGNAPLLAYVNDRNEPNWQRGMLTARGAFALADMNQVTNAVDLDGRPVARIAPGRVQLLVRNFVAKLARAPRVTVVRDQADLKARFPDLYARAVAARPQGDFDTAPAMGYAFGEGEVIIFTGRIVTEQQLRFVLAHETLGHFGLRGIMPGPKFDALMETLYKGDSRVQRAVDAAMAANSKLSRAEAVEEYLSDYAAVLDTSIVARVWNGIKAFLNALNIRTGDEMTRYLLDQARRYARSKSGATFDAQSVGARLHEVESLGGTGRFSTAPSLRDVNTAAGLLRDSIGGLPMSIEEGWAYLKGQGVNSATTWDGFKSKFLSLANFRARQNPGLAALEELIDETRNISMSLKVSYNERLRLVLNRAIAGEVGGISDKQTETVNRMLYAGQRAAVAQTRAIGDLGNVPLFTMVDGKLTKNAPEIARLRAIGHRSFEEMRDGFEYDVTFDEAGQTVTKKERFDGVKGLTKDSIEWRGYVKLREAMDDIELELLRARYEGALQERDLAFRQIAATVPDGELSAEERAAMTTLAQTYGGLYLSNVTQDPTGRAVLDVDFQTYANDVLRTANAALIGEKSDRFDTLRQLLTEDRVFTTKDGKERRTLPAAMEAQLADDLIAQLQAFKSRMRLGEDRYVVQNKVKQVILSELASKDADKYTKRTIATGYTPILREGKFQMRVEAFIGNKIVRLQDSYREQLVYSQFDTASESMEAVQKTNALFGDNEFEVMAYDQDAGEYRLQKVKLRAVSERALDAIAAPPELNLNEFIRGLRQFDITLTPEKMEDVIVALTRQNSNARNRLERSFTPGAKMDGVMATMRHIESRASTVAKVLMRPRLAELMDRSMESTNRLWNGDAAALQKLKERAEALAANPTAKKEEIADAQRAYEQYAYMYNQTNPGGGLPRRGNQFYNEAASTVAFLDGNRNVDESDFGSGPLVSRIRAATSMMQLGGSVATGALNLLSLVTNGVPYLSSYNPKTAFGGGFSVGSVLAEMSRAGKQVGAPGVTSREANTAEFYDRVAAAVAADPALEAKYGLKAREAAFIAQEIRDGAMIPAQSNALVGTARGRTTSGFMQKFQDGWMWTFNVTEQASRRTLGLAAYRLEFDRKVAAGMSETEADAAARAFAVKAMQYTMGEYSVLNRPPAWRSGIQSFMYMYKVFPTTSVQMFMNLSRNGKVGMIAGIVLLSGIAGLPFAEDLEDLADTLAQRLKISGWQGARYETAQFIDSILPGMSTELLKGLVNEYVPADIAGRTSLGNLLPGTDILLAGSDSLRGLGEIFGPAPSMLIGTAQFAADAIAAPFSTTTSLEDVFRESPITMARALGDTYAYLQNGAIVDRRGYVVSDQMTTGTVVARALGFYPSEAAKQYEMIRSAKRMTDYQREVATGFRTAWIKATMRGDRARAREIEAAVEDWNAGAKGTALEVRNFVKNSQKALKEARRPAVERTLRSAPDAAEADLQRMVDLLTAN